MTDLVKHVKQSIEKASKEESNINKEVLSLEGLSSNKVRHLFNNICSLKDCNYLEIGLYRGSTFCSAISNNDGINYAVGIDNWSQAYGYDTEHSSSNRKEDCLSNIKKFAPINLKYKIIDSDSFSINLNSIGKDFNIYFYDGEHTACAQMMALTYFDECLADEFIFIVDDFNEREGWDVMQGTFDAIKFMGYKKLFEQTLPSRYNGDRENWWNGIFICVLKKE
jgi:hypothetical protein